MHHTTPRTMAAAVCALTALLLSVAPVAAQEVPDTSGRPHRAMLDVGLGYGFIDSSSGGDHRFSGAFTAAYLVPIPDTDFDVGVRFESVNLAIGPHSAYSVGEIINQQQHSWTLALRVDWMLTDLLPPASMTPDGDGMTVGVAPYFFVGGGRAKFSPEQPYSPVTAFHVSATAFQAGVGFYAGGGFNYELFGHPRAIGISVGPELSIIRTFGSVDSTAVVLNFFKGGLVF